MLQSASFWIFFEICVNLFFGFLFVFFMHGLLVKKKPERLSLWIFAGLIGVAYSAYLLIPARTLELYFSDSWVFIIILLYAFLFYRDPWWVKLLWFTVLYSVISTTASFSYYFFSVVFRVSFESLLLNGLPRLLFLLFNSFLSFLLLYVIIRLSAPLKGQRSLSRNPVLLLILINLVALSIEEVMFRLYPDIEFPPLLFLIVCALTLALCLVSLILYRILCAYTEKMLRLDYIEQERQEINNRISEINTLFTTVNQLHHDMKKHLDVAMDLTARGEQEKAHEYLLEAAGKLPVMYSTGCLSLDSALTLREKMMSEQNITFLPELCDLSVLPIKDLDFCSIIMNLIDNSVEALNRYREELPERFVKLEIRFVQDMLLIRCTNPCTTVPLKKEKNRFVSSKRLSGFGMGIPIIESIVDEVSGVYEWEQINGYFIAKISIPFKRRT